MATTHLTFPLRLPNLSAAPYQSKQPLTESLPVSTWTGLGLRNLSTTVRGLGTDLSGDFGARDPFPAELESKFGEKVLGNVDTDHKILIPNLAALSLAQQNCQPVSPLQPPMSEDDATKLLKKVVGWKLVNDDGVLKLQCLWKLRDYQCGVELVNRIYKVVESTGHFPDLHLEQTNQVRAVLWTSSIGGLSMNDFIVAAKLDEMKTSDLATRKKSLGLAKLMALRLPKRGPEGNSKPKGSNCS